MARARNIKPSFFANEYLADLPFSARLLFIGLWTLADREGRLEDRPKGIKGKLFPYEEVDVDGELQMLADSCERFIIRYEAEGKRYIQVRKFSIHQSPHIAEKPSIIPPPLEDQHGESLTVKMAGMATGIETGDQPSTTRDDSRGARSTRRAPTKHSASTVRASDECDTSMSQKPLNPESFNLNPEPPFLNPVTRAAAQGEGEDEQDDQGSSTRETKPPSLTDRRFDTFWSFYPKKVGKLAARKAFEKIKMTDELHKRILKAIILQKKTDQWLRDSGRYIPNPATWLNRGEWDNEIPEEVSGYAADRNDARSGAGVKLRSGSEDALAGFHRG